MNPNLMLRDLVAQPAIYNATLLFARALLTYIFIMAGWAKIAGYAGVAGYMEKNGCSCSDATLGDCT
ncbi:DoxX family membrane protein [Acinetobacter sp. c1-l78]|uniref:DoxX family membrane protein n=1 Tax=Acinetobacter sp. c1-l78 TaxID=3342803 RepID=UPI0035BA8E20